LTRIICAVWPGRVKLSKRKDPNFRAIFEEVVVKWRVEENRIAGAWTRLDFPQMLDSTNYSDVGLGLRHFELNSISHPKSSRF
jgi:hypothetical protein